MSIDHASADPCTVFTTHVFSVVIKFNCRLCVEHNGGRLWLSELKKFVLRIHTAFSLGGLLKPNPRHVLLQQGFLLFSGVFCLLNVFQIATGFLYSFFFFCFRTTVFYFILHVGSDLMGFLGASELYQTVIGKVIHYWQRCLLLLKTPQEAQTFNSSQKLFIKILSWKLSSYKEKS